MNQQTVLESKRVLAILDDTLDDLVLLEYLPTYLSQFAAADLQALGSEIQQIVSESVDLERKLEMGQGAQNEELMFAHKHSVREICDVLRTVGYTKDRMPETPQSESLVRYHNIISILRSLMNDKFNTTVEEDLLKFEILRDTVSREQTASADVKALNREFQSERNLRIQEVAKRDHAIAQLSDELQTIQDNAIEEAKDFERITREQQQIAAQTYAKQEEELVMQVKALDGQLSKDEDTNKKEEAGLRQERRKREQFLDGLLTQYDTEMTEKTEDLETLTKDYKTDQGRLEDLEKDIKVFDEETGKRAEEQATETDRKCHHMDILVRMETSSKLVQAFWRGYAVRLMMKKKAGKKKRSKKGKGKKKRR